jgi:type 1 fimbria pilin
VIIQDRKETRKSRLPKICRYNYNGKEVKVKKTALALLLTGIGALVAPHVYASGTGSVEFSGKILESVCELKTTHVVLGEVSTAALAGKRRNPSTAFELQFKNCPAHPPNPRLIFGPGVEGLGLYRDLFPLAPGSKAAGVGVKISYSSDFGPTLVPGRPNFLFSTKDAEGTFIFKFTAKYLPIGHIKQVVPGDANATVEVVISHQ